jgi:hypothetical protein
MDEATIVAVVQKIEDNGKNPGYVVTTSEKIIGSITFSLDNDIWKENANPKAGEIVVLSQLRKKRAGWRALNARFYRPSDEEIRKEK